MKRLMVGVGLMVFLLSAKFHAQSGGTSPAPESISPAADAAHVSPASCVILKRIGRIGRTESRLSHFGISGKQFRYVEGKLPEGFSRHGKMTENDVRKLQARGAQVLVLDGHYTSQDLQEARTDCRGESGEAQNQVEAKASPAAAPAPVASAPAYAPNPLTAKPSTPAPEAMVSAPAPKPVAAKVPTAKAEDSAPSTGTTVAALLDVSSTPVGADVYIDEQLVGHTPATTLILRPGNHKIAVKKNGFVVWKKKLTLPSGPTSVNAQLLRKSK